MILTSSWYAPDWELPQGVFAAVSTRQGGVSDGKYASMNLSQKVDDDDASVGENRFRFAGELPDSPELAWLTQVHGNDVVAAHSIICESEPPEADASWTDQQGIACVVTTADCVPVLFAADDGERVAAAHAGWRGLTNGILAAVAKGFSAGAYSAYVGPCISQACYQVGHEVVDALTKVGVNEKNFRPDEDGKFLVDLAGIAKDQLQLAGARQITCADSCTHSDPKKFFSARRDGNASGRFATAIWQAKQPVASSSLQ